tara:strand:+ start:1443 stop:2495 length:1053 start_codon:yes stop_codon:yes gene_type:complete
LEKRNNTELLTLKAFNGDSLLVKTFNNDFEEKIILIDGGTPSTFDYFLKKEIKLIQKIDLLVLTHIDNDHIGGLIKFFKNSLIEKIEIGEIWFNHPELTYIETGQEISFSQGNTLYDLIKEKKPNSNLITSITSSLKAKKFTWGEIEILSPTSDILLLFNEIWSTNDLKKNIKKTVSDEALEDELEDLVDLSKKENKPKKKIEDDISNSSSISFILKSLDSSFLFLADSRAEIIVQELIKKGYNSNNKLSVDYVKVSHHGSKENTSSELLDMIDSNNYIFSTNGGSSKDKHPSRETISKIIYHKKRDLKIERRVYLNYSIEEIEKRRGKFLKEVDFTKGNWKLIEKNIFK